MTPSACRRAIALCSLLLAACSSAPTAPPSAIPPIPHACLEQCRPAPIPPPEGSDERVVIDWIVSLQQGYGECLDLHAHCAARLADDLAATRANRRR